MLPDVSMRSALRLQLSEERSQRTFTDFSRSMDEYFNNSQGPGNAETRVAKQFIEALVFEGIVTHVFETRAKANPSFIASLTTQIDRIYDLQLHINLATKQFYCLATIGAFDRVRIASESLRIQRYDDLGAKSFQVPRLDDLVAAIVCSHADKLRLLNELQQTVALCEWNDCYLNLTHLARRNLNFHQLESAIHEGHPYHPCFKTRSGFSYQDHHNYGPEAANTFQLHWLAVKKRNLNSALPVDDVSFWQQELGQSHYRSLRTALREAVDMSSDYALVPIHPWQWSHLKESRIEKELQSKEIIYLGAVGDVYQATQSLRTLVNVTHSQKANIKLPMDIICTSSRRNLQRHFVCTAPLISRWLQRLVKEDPFLQRTGFLILVSEYAAMLYEPEVDAMASEEEQQRVANLQGLIGCIFRESVLTKLPHGCAALPFSALTLVEQDTKPFIAFWLEHYGVTPWLNRLCEVVLVPIWHMLVHHGVAFEAHAQNLILIHRDGWPEHIVLRDFHENTEYVHEYLGRPEVLPDFAAFDAHFATIADDDGYRMSAIDELRELVMDTVFVYNLSDLGFLLAKHGFLDEETFWQIIRGHLTNYRLSGVTEQARFDKLNAEKKRIAVESLLKKKVENAGVCEVFHHEIANDLCHTN